MNLPPPNVSWPRDWRSHLPLIATLARYGVLISSEWEFAKGLQLFEEERELYDAMECWVECAYWIVWQLCGRYLRNACTAR
mgnify:CR=1 FL=1